jgi:predicted dehydrogenase
MAKPTAHTIGILMNGVTGRMGTHQHLERSVLAIRREGGVRLAGGETIMPEPVLVGRSAAKLRALAERTGLARWTTDLGAALSDPSCPVYFDALSTALRPEALRQAIAAGKHVYSEKPTALSSAEAYGLYRAARAAGVKHGVVQDKLWLPGLVKLKRLLDEGAFGRVLAVRAEFGYWVFTGFDGRPQRPSWNYRKEEGGSILFDMFCHWRYVLDDLFGGVRSVCCRAATHIPKRLDEAGRPYAGTAEDAAYALFDLAGGAVAQFNSSWCTRVRRDDLLVLHVDGTDGSAVAGLRDVWIQPAAETPRVVWNPDIEQPLNFFDGWRKAADPPGGFDNAFKRQWELFLRHVVKDEPFPWDLREGAKGVQLAEAAAESSRTRAWVDLPELPR